MRPIVIVRCLVNDLNPSPGLCDVDAATIGGGVLHIRMKARPFESLIQ